MKFLKNKAAVVTGAGRGIGRAIALELAAQGAMIVVNDPGVSIDGSGKDSIPAKEVVDEIIGLGGKAVANYDSVADEIGSARIVSAAVENFGKLDIMVCNAGILRDNPVDEMTADIWDSVIKVHLYGVFYCTRAACALFRKQKSGRLVAMSSPTALGFAGRSNYSAAKSGILGFIRSVALEMKEYNATANIVWPNSVTRMTLAECEAKGVPIPTELPGPEGTATLVAYLSTDEASAINGQTFDVLGGKITLIAPESEVKMLYKEKKWEVEELINAFPSTLGRKLVQPQFLPPA
jgi:NAD(P)-dependent dehydrogenase (short-subunit alcohol dehydrogenase family)